MAKIVVNAVGDPCPIPVVKATKALKGMTEPGTLEVQVVDLDDDAVDLVPAGGQQESESVCGKEGREAFRGDDPGRSAAGGRKGRRGGLLHPGEKRKYGSGHRFGPYGPRQ